MVMGQDESYDEEEGGREVRSLYPAPLLPVAVAVSVAMVQEAVRVRPRLLVVPVGALQRRLLPLSSHCSSQWWRAWKPLAAQQRCRSSWTGRVRAHHSAVVVAVAHACGICDSELAVCLYSCLCACVHSGL